MFSTTKPLSIVFLLLITMSVSAHGETWKELLAQADSLSNEFDYDSAIVMGKMALEKATENFGKMDTATALVLYRLGTYNFYKSKYGQAELLLKKALVIRKRILGSEHPDVATSLSSLAYIYEKNEQYSEAEHLHKRALKIRKKTLDPEHPDVATSLVDLGLIYSAKEEFSEAEHLYKESLKIREKFFGPEHIDVGRVLFKLATLYKNQGKYAKSEQLFKRVLVICEKYDRKYYPDLAFCLNNLAVLYIKQGRHEEAVPLFKRSIAIMKEVLGPEHPCLVPSLCNLADIYLYSLGRLAEAEPLYKSALEIAEKTCGCEHPDVARILELFSPIYVLKSDPRTSVEMSRKAFEIRQKNFQDNGYVLSEKDALTFSQKVRASANNYLSCYFDGGLNEASFPEKASDIVLAAKGEVSDLIFRRQKSLVIETDSATLAFAESLRYTKFQLSQLFIQGPGGDTTGAYRHQLDSLSNLANELESSLARRSASFRKFQSYRRISTDRIASLLPKKSVLLEYLSYDYYQLKPAITIPRYLVVTLDGKGKGTVADLGEASGIDSLISDYREHMLRVSSQQHMPLKKDKSEYEIVARKLYDVLIKPVDDYLSDEDLVFIAPDGGLNLVSFAGLIDDEGRYVVERVPIHHLSAGRDLIRLQYREKIGQGLFALGDPDYNASVGQLLAQAKSPELTSAEASPYLTRNVRSGCGDLRQMTMEPLPSSRREVEQVVRQWEALGNEPAIICFGPEASEENFKVQAPGKRVIHLATHGYYLQGRCNPSPGESGLDLSEEFIGENPLLQSGLFFAGANLHGKLADSLGFDDGILTAYEVSAMDLEGTDLVVLSACETGLGEVKEGEGVYGLRRAFQMAGARTVVSALWPVSDKSTAEMMAQLYSESKKSLPERIRQMQLAQIKKLRRGGLSDHPYNWAGFIALGDWR